METPMPYKQFLDDYAHYTSEVLKPTLDEFHRLFGNWSKTPFERHRPELSRLASPSPLYFTHARVKRPESVVDKILRKPELFPEGLTINSVTRMKDAVAGRAVVYFLSGLQLLDREIRNSEVLEVSEDTPPVAYLREALINQLEITHVDRDDQEASHAAIVYTVRFRTDYLPKEKRPWVELQVRTLTDHLWREVQHVLGYKPYKKTSFAVSTHFQIIEAQLESLDEHFNLLLEELLRFQETGTYREDDNLNAENLPAVLTELGIGCAQKEIDGLLKLLTSRGIRTVGKLRNIAPPRRLELIRDTYREYEDRNPTNFEIVASLAATHGFEDENQVVEAITTQIQFLHTWVNMKRTAKLQI